MAGTTEDKKGDEEGRLKEVLTHTGNEMVKDVVGGPWSKVYDAKKTLETEAEKDTRAGRFLKKAGDFVRKLPVVGGALRWIGGATGTVGEVAEGAKKKYIDDVASGRSEEEQHFKNLLENMKRLAIEILILLKSSMMDEQVSSGKLLADKSMDTSDKKESVQVPAGDSSSKTGNESKEIRLSKKELEENLAKGVADKGITTAANTALEAAKDIGSKITR